MSGPVAPPLPTLRDLLARAHLRLIVFALALATTSLLVSGVIVIRAYSQRNLELIARTVAYTVEPAMVFGDPQAVRDGMMSVGAVSGIERIEVRDPAGPVLAAWDRQDHGLGARIERAANRVLWSRPATGAIVHAGRPIGQVRIFGNSEGVLRYALSAAIIGLACIGLTLIATRILARRLQQDVIEPLDHVAAVARDVRLGGRFDQRVPAAGIAEVDRFGQDFNALLGQLQGWHDGLTTQNAELARQATHDPLTGLGNRALFERIAAAAIARAEVGEADSETRPFAVLFADIDAFKQINDRFGHESGDAALIAVADRLRASAPHRDCAFRLGGDEFALLLPGPIGRAGIAAVTRRIAVALQQPFRLPSGTDARPRVSLGVAVYPDDGESAAALLRGADRRMYQHKQRSRSLREPGAERDDP